MLQRGCFKNLLRKRVVTWKFSILWSGWLKNNASVYHIRLLSGSKLEEAKQEFNVNCSVQVYSVQACIPKDPASLWNAEFVQAEELFKQPPNIVNCLHDNRS